MLKPPTPTMPGMTDTLDFVKNLWGSMNIPGTGIPGIPGMPGMPGLTGLAAPTLSTDDLDKRIADLKAVESWLNMNITMLRGTIQAMEVQRGTLTALKSMGASMAEAMRQSGVSADKMAGMPFAPFFNPAAAQPAAGKPSATPSPASSSPGAAPAPGPAASGPAAGPSSGASGQPGAAAPAGADGGAAAAAAMGMPAAVAWWNLLQDQFRQAVTSAMNSAASAAPGAPSTPSAPEAPAAKPAAPTSASTPTSAPQGDAPAGNNGNGKTRTPRSRTDKT